MVNRESRLGRLNLPWLATAVAAVCLLCIAQSAFAGSLVGWGSNMHGQATPPAGNDFVAIAVGGKHDLALKSDGSIVGWGDNSYGQATPPAGAGFIAIAAGGYHSLALKSDGSIVAWGGNWWGETLPPAGNDFVAIAAGLYYNLALKSDGSIVGWGISDGSPMDHGQVTGTPDGNDYVAIAACSGHCLALKQDGSIVGWARNDYGQATPPAGNDFVAIAVGFSHSLALKQDGSIVGWGNNGDGRATPPAGAGFIAIAAGGYHSLALKLDGSIVGWGKNNEGQATPPDGNDFIAIASGAYHSLGLTDCRYILGGDFNDDGIVNFIDFSFLGAHWLETNCDKCGRCGSADFTDDGKVGPDDLREFVYENWLTGTKIPPLPEQASNPTPSDGASYIDVNTDLSWTAGTDATSYDVYLGMSEPLPFIGNQTATTYEPGTLAEATMYYWRIDSVNDWGKTFGKVWSFTTFMPPPPP